MVAPAGHGPAISGLPLYLLVDPYLREPHLANMDTRGEPNADELRLRREQAWGRRVQMAEEPPPRVALVHAPYLVALDSSEDPLLIEIFAEARQEHQSHLQEGTGVYSIGGLLEADMEADAIMARIQQLWRILFKGKPGYLRIGDPRVMTLVSHMLTPIELQLWLGPIAKWHIPATNGEWMSLSGAADADLASTEEDIYRMHRRLDELKRTKPAFPMTRRREQQLVCSEAVSQAIHALMREAMAGERALPQGFPKSNDYQVALAAAESFMSTRAGAHLADMVAYISRAMTYSPSKE